MLGDVDGLDVVELGCGTGYFSAWLARRGARPVGVDVTPAQLETARRLQAETGIEFPLVEASAEDVPLPDASFDLAFSEYGASIWCDPHRWIPEAQRLLRPGGRLVFLLEQPARVPLLRSRIRRRRREELQRPLVRHAPLRVDAGRRGRVPARPRRLVRRAARRRVRDRAAGRAVRARRAPSAHEYYDFVTAEWARNWPVEEIWAARKPRLTLASTSPQRRAILEQLRDPVRGRRARLRRGRRSARRRSDRARPTARRGQGALRPRRRATSRSASTPPSSSTAGSTGRRPTRDDAARDAARARRAERTPSSRASACSARATDVVAARADATSPSGRSRTRRVDAYVASGEWEGRAGAYAIQGLGGRLVERIEGDYLNVVGLPGALLVSLLESARQSCCKPAGRLAAPYGLVQVDDRVRRPRHGGRSRHRQHARLRARARHRAVRAVGRRDRPAHGRGARGRGRGEAHARPHARDDLRDPPAQGRRHRRLRRHGADAPPLHPEGAPEPLRASARRRLRAVGRDGRREARGRGGDALRGRAPGLPHRGADGRGDRRRASRRRADREHDRRHRRRHERGRRHLARRHRRLAVDARGRRRDGRGDRQPHQEGVQAPRRPADRGGDQARDRLRATACARSCRRRFAAATCSPACRRP